MKVYLATDHTGFEFKKKLIEFLKKGGYEAEDCGAYMYDPDDDYPDFIGKAAEMVAKDPENSRGVVFGGSGQGEMMLANKFKGVRCALFYAAAVPIMAVNIEGKESVDPLEMLRLTREHNGANMLSMGIRFLKEADILRAVQLWLESPNATHERHLRRIEKIRKIEQGI